MAKVVYAPEDVTDRPWTGPDSATRWTVTEFAEMLGMDHPQSGDDLRLPREVTRAAVAICRAYGIKGICDPLYIANMINNHRLGVTPA